MKTHRRVTNEVVDPAHGGAAFLLYVGLLCAGLSCETPPAAVRQAEHKEQAPQLTNEIVRQPGSLAGWPALETKEANPQARAARLACAYLEQLATRPVQPVRWNEQEGVPSPALEMAAQRTIRKLMEGATFRRKTETGPVRAYRFFKEGDKGPVWAIWSVAPCGPIALRPLDDSVTVTDLMGNAEVMKPRENSVILTPSDSPVFVKLSTMAIMGVMPVVSIVERPEKIYAGEPAQVVLEVWNPFRDPLSVTVALSLPRERTGPVSEARAKIEQGAKERVAMTFVPASEAKAGPQITKVSIKFDRAELPSAELPIPVEVQKR